MKHTIDISTIIEFKDESSPKIHCEFEDGDAQLEIEIENQYKEYTTMSLDRGQVIDLVEFLKTFIN